MKAALTAVGYPEKADPAQINKPMVVAILVLLVLYVAMVYAVSYTHLTLPTTWPV